ncbi:hypothetical protein [Microbulbifer epialgicus]|uniref:Uncharacterized protein n=1 Tax=Microbulbifer epialgicus TaxID=393907 RepID=A0ABV4NXC4_9GAMM
MIKLFMDKDNLYFAFTLLLAVMGGFMFFCFLWLLEAVSEKFGIFLPHWVFVISLGSVVGLIIGGVDMATRCYSRSLQDDMSGSCK